jgi:hypoxanthine-DNA glycosylase
MVPRAMPRDTASSRSPLLRSFAPLADGRSRVLVLGTMPGPEALRKQEYYGFKGNHFWKIMSDLLADGRALDYGEKLALLRRHRIAVWDVLASCAREGAADSAIRDPAPNDIPGLLARHPGIHTIICNGTTSARLFARYFGGTVAVPMIPLPSTSPAHATMPYALKRARWTVVVEQARSARHRAVRQARAPR